MILPLWPPMPQLCQLGRFVQVFAHQVFDREGFKFFLQVCKQVSLGFFTDELDVGLYLKHVRVAQAGLGDRDFHCERYAANT